MLTKHLDTIDITDAMITADALPARHRRLHRRPRRPLHPNRPLKTTGPRHQNPNRKGWAGQPNPRLQPTIKIKSSRTRRAVSPSMDSGFPGGVGKAWQKGDFEPLLGEVTSRVFYARPDSTVVYPGHGDDTTVGAERPHLVD
jgi:hypothetical protein